MQILRKTEEIIYPGASAHPTLYKLSEPDQTFRNDVGMSGGLYFYKQGPASSEALRRSLSKTLAYFYPFTGRLVERAESVTTCPDLNGGGGEAKAACGGQEGEGTCPQAIGGTQESNGGREDEERRVVIGGRADVRCLDQGALFCEAWTDTRLDAYEPDFQPHPDFNLLRLSGHEHIFLFQVKITYFSCGGICLCVQDRHCLVDGATSAHFMKCWVEITNGEESPSVCPYINHPPLEMMYRPKDLHNSFIEDYSTHYLTFPLNPTQEVSNKIFHFTPKFIDDLKSEISHEGGQYSSFECIAAYMSKNLILARGITCDEEVCLTYPVNGRGKLEPPLPPSYFGNVVFQTHANVKVRDLVEKPLSHTTHLIREATSKITDAHIRSVMKWSTEQPFPMSMMPSFSCSSKHIFLNTWTGFPLCNFNFGWGNPLCCRARLFPFELVLLLPSYLGRGHIEVLVSLNEDHMKNLDSLLSQKPLY